MPTPAQEKLVSGKPGHVLFYPSVYVRRSRRIRGCQHQDRCRHLWNHSADAADVSLEAASDKLKEAALES